VVEKQQMDETNQAAQTAIVPVPRRGDPTWDVARFYPVQGEWTEADYLALGTNHLVELSDGCLAMLPMPTHRHQLVVALLYGLLKAFVDVHAPGIVLFAPLPMRLWPGKFREPDLLYMREENRHRIHDYWEGADLVMEVISPSNPGHDRETKREEYARAGIPEYWIIDLLSDEILVLVLEGTAYRVHGTFGRGTQTTSAVLPGFTVAVDQVLDLAGSQNP
jgi:Uma2 family endonuclease